MVAHACPSSTVFMTAPPIAVSIIVMMGAMQIARDAEDKGGGVPVIFYPIVVLICLLLVPRADWRCVGDLEARVRAVRHCVRDWHRSRARWRCASGLLPCFGAAIVLDMADMSAKCAYRRFVGVAVC